MTLPLISLGVLVLGIILPMVLARAPRTGLLLGMGAILVASLLCAVCAVAVLTQGAFAATETFAWPLPLGRATLAIDGLSAWFLLTLSLLSGSVAVYSWAYMQEEIGHGAVPAFSSLLCLLMASMLIVICAADAILFLVGWEAMSVSAFFLVSFHDRRPEVRYGAWMYLIATHLATAFFLVPMFAVIASRAADTSYSAIAGSLRGAGPGLCVTLFVLGLVGFGTKAGFMPMHVWLPRAHPVAPTPVSALLSGVVVKTGIYAIIRLLTWLPPLPARCAILMLVVGIVSGVLGVLYAIAQHDIKRLLAYHTVENIGIIALGIGMGMMGQATGHPALAALGYAGALLHTLNHAMFKGLLFLSAGAVIHSTGTGEIDRLGGLAKKTPWNAALFLIAAVAICGLPPFNGFISEWLIYGSLFSGAARLHSALSAFAVLGLVALSLMGGLALACFAKVFSVVFLGEPREALAVRATPRWMLWGMAIPAAVCFIVGFLPAVVVPLVGRATASVVAMPAGGFAGLAGNILAPAYAITLLLLLFVGLVAGLLLLRRRAGLSATPALGGVCTWGCGYPYPSPRIQYTASSFGWSLVSSFRRLLWPERHLRGNQGVFPVAGELSTHTSDVAEEDIFAPVFSGIGRLLAMFRTLSLRGGAELGQPDEEGETSLAHAEPPVRIGPFRAACNAFLSAMRRGNIQVCLTYLVVTLIIVFAIEALVTRKPAASAPSAANPPALAGEPKP